MLCRLLRKFHVEFPTITYTLLFVFLFSFPFCSGGIAVDSEITLEMGKSVMSYFVHWIYRWMYLNNCKQCIASVQEWRIIWRIRWRIARIVLCCTVCHNSLSCTHTLEKWHAKLFCPHPIFTFLRTTTGCPHPYHIFPNLTLNGDSMVCYKHSICVEYFQDISKFFSLTRMI